MTFLIRLFLATAYLGFSNLAWGADEWKLSLGKVPKNAVPICLFRDKKTAGLFSSGKWVAKIGFEDAACSEKIYGEIQSRTLFLAFDGTDNAFTPKAYLVERYDIYCPKDTNEVGYTKCKSDFFMSGADGNSYRNFDSEFWHIINDSGALSLLNNRRKLADEEEEKVQLENQQNRKIISDQCVAKIMASLNYDEAQALYEGCLDIEAGAVPPVLEKIESLKMNYCVALSNKSESISEFDALDKKCSSLSGLPEISRALKNRSALVAQKMKKDADAAINSGSVDLMRNFLSEYASVPGNDPTIIKVSGAISTQSKLLDISRSIEFCKEQISSSKNRISRERKIGLVSGYENKGALYEAGQTIVYCQELIASKKSEYKEITGKEFPD